MIKRFRNFIGRVTPIQQPKTLVDRHCSAICEAVGSEYTLDALHTLISRVYRKKPHIIKKIQLPNCISGAVLPLPDADLVLVQEGLPDLLQTITILHEDGHLVCGHIMHVNPSLPPLETFMQSPYEHLAKAVMRSSSVITSQDQILEEEAEKFAQQLLEKFYYLSETTDVTRKLYGE